MGKAGNEMTLPNFIIFGAIKSGTGALYQYLDHHPQIYCCPVKEPRFFSQAEDKSAENRVSQATNPIKSIEEYERLFDGVRNEIAIGEASSNYINSHYAAMRIKDSLPDVRLIATLRNPVDRAYAHYRMSGGKEILTEKNIESFRDQGWALTSLYFDKLKNYYELFGSDQIKILIFEQWTGNIPDVLIDLYEFLGVDKTFRVPSNIKYLPGEVRWPGLRRGSMLRRLKRHVPGGILAMINSFRDSYVQQSKNNSLDRKVREIMFDWYKEDILRLQSLIQKDLQEWLI